MVRLSDSAQGVPLTRPSGTFIAFGRSTGAPDRCATGSKSRKQERAPTASIPQSYPRPKNLHYILPHLFAWKRGRDERFGGERSGGWGVVPYRAAIVRHGAPKRAPLPTITPVRGNSVGLIEGSPMRRVHDDGQAKNPGRPAGRKPHIHLRTNRVGANAPPARFLLLTTPRLKAGGRFRAPALGGMESCSANQRRSKRSASMTLTQAATKSATNFCAESDWA